MASCVGEEPLGGRQEGSHLDGERGHDRNFGILKSVIEMNIGSSSPYNRGSQGVISGMSQQSKERT